jgi:hypothetical protein
MNSFLMKFTGSERKSSSILSHTAIHLDDAPQLSAKLWITSAANPLLLISLYKGFGIIVAPKLLTVIRDL